MKKRVIIIGIIIIVISLVIFGLYTLNKDKDVLDDLPEYPGNIVCELEGVDIYDDEEIPFITRAYINVENNQVLSSVYQTVAKNQNKDMLTAILKLYNDIDGITVFADDYDEYNVITIKYDYENIDLKQVEEELGELLDDDSFFKKYKKIPISYEEYKKVELKGYECHEN